MKKVYTKPNMEVVSFNAENIATTLSANAQRVQTSISKTLTYY